MKVYVYTDGSMLSCNCIIYSTFDMMQLEGGEWGLSIQGVMMLYENVQRTSENKMKKITSTVYKWRGAELNRCECKGEEKHPCMTSQASNTGR
jgi:hypothetical protein